VFDFDPIAAWHQIHETVRAIRSGDHRPAVACGDVGEVYSGGHKRRTAGIVNVPDDGTVKAWPCKCRPTTRLRAGWTIIDVAYNSLPIPLSPCADVAYNATNRAQLAKMLSRVLMEVKRRGVKQMRFPEGVRQS
jgi:hypothetical protein